MEDNDDSVRFSWRLWRLELGLWCFQDCSSPRRAPPPAPPRSSRLPISIIWWPICNQDVLESWLSDQYVTKMFRPDTAGPGRPEVNTGIGGKTSSNGRWWWWHNYSDDSPGYHDDHHHYQPWALWVRRAAEAPLAAPPIHHGSPSGQSQVSSFNLFDNLKWAALTFWTI